MIYDVRTYEIAPGRVPDYMKNVKEIAIPIRQDHGVKLGGWYYSEVGPLNQVVHIWAYEDTKHLIEGAEAVRADPRWTGEYMPSQSGLGAVAARCHRGPSPLRASLLRAGGVGGASLVRHAHL